MQSGYKLITSVNQIGEFQKDLIATEEISYDLETRGLDFLVDKVRLAQYELNGNIYILHLDSSKEVKKLFKYITELIENSEKVVISHNSKFELKFTLANTGILLHDIYDTQLAEIILTAGIGTKYPALDKLVEFYCDVKLDKSYAMKFVESDIITEEMLLYAATDVKYLKKIKEFQLGEADRWKLNHILALEMKLLPIVARMEFDGVLLDLDEWLKLYEHNLEEVKRYESLVAKEFFERTSEKVLAQSKDALEAINRYDVPLKPKTKKKQKYLKEITDKAFILKEVKNSWNIASNKQIKRALHLIGYPLESTGVALLTSLQNDELIDNLLKYREHAKLASTFGKNWGEFIHPVTGRIHPSHHQMGTTTGRWAVSKPNMQNIVLKKEFRGCFKSRPGYLLITADYSQAELRLVGAVTGEKNIIDAYMNNEDIHAMTASIVYETPVEELTEKQRNRGKTLNFSILYGATDFGISRRNKDVSLGEARELVKKFFEGFPTLANWIKILGNELWKRKYSKTPLGRIRFFEDRTVFSDSQDIYKQISRVKREGINHVIQGGIADALKLAMVDAYYNKPFEHDDFRFLIQIHDEVVLEVREDLVQDGVNLIVDCMQRAAQKFLGDIPAIVDYNVSSYWSK